MTSRRYRSGSSLWSFVEGGDESELPLGAVVRHLEPAIVEERGERAALPDGVAERVTQCAADIFDLLELDGGPFEERLDVGFEVGLSGPEGVALGRDLPDLHL